MNPVMIKFNLLHVSILWIPTCVGSLGSLPASSRTFLSARAGSSVLLPCEWRNLSSPSPHIEWRTFSETVFERRGEEQYQGEGYEHRVDVPEEKLLKGDCSLELKDIRPADAGVYESYLLLKRMKRSLSSKRVFIQSVELSVEEISEESSKNVYSNKAVTDDARTNFPPQKMIVFLPLVTALLLLQ